LGSVAHIDTVFTIVPLSMIKQALEEKIVSNFFVTFAFAYGMELCTFVEYAE
jgi:hypothetical protein